MGDAAGRPNPIRGPRQMRLAGGKGWNMLGIPPMFWYDTCAIEFEQDVMATFLRRPCLFLTLWIAGSQRPAIARTVVSGSCVMYTGRPQNRTYCGTASRREEFSVRTGVRASHRKAETTLGSAGQFDRAQRHERPVRFAGRATGEDARRQSTLVHFRGGCGMRQDGLRHQSVFAVHTNRQGRG
jgi:hypothetical protein